jgi:WD40 repeat protein/energy-coupling factor transporter ATP-binding protein EcfA2
MSDSHNAPKKPSVNAENNSNAVGGISAGGDISGNIHIGNVGYTADQVSILIAKIQSTFQPKPFDGRCPYKGLDVFEEEDAELFFGREKLEDDLVSRVKDSRTVFVTGPSGSGKSSLVRAGLIHALKQGAIKGSDRWLYATMKPGRDPIESLATAFSRLKSPELGNYFRQHVDQVNVLHECAESALTDNKNQRLVIFIDQFEEVFTQISKEEERVSFLNLLTHAATIENGRVIILFSMRSDFVSNCATYPQLNALLNQQFVQIGAMQPGELVNAIAQPALRVGLRIDPDLIAQIINDMRGEPGTLPLMQFALKDLFEARQAKGSIIALTLSDYLEREGIQKMLERHADEAFAKLSKSEQELAHSIFSGLIKIGRDTQVTRHTALFDDLVPANTKAEEVKLTLQKLADARLITTEEKDSNNYTITHEKLIDAWPWLKKLVNENRDVIALQNEISADAKEWEEHKRDASYLYSGGRLATAQEKIKDLTLSEMAQRFLKIALKVEKDAHLQRERRLWLTVIASIAAAVLFLVLGSFGWAKSNEATARANDAATAQANAESQAKRARVGELSAQSVSLRDKNFQNSLLLGIEAYQNLVTIQSYEALFDSAQAYPQLRAFLNGHTSSVESVAFSPDGKTLASGGYDNTIILWDVATRLPIGQPLTGHTSSVQSVAFSPDGKTLAAGSWDSTLIMWDVATHQMIGQPLIGHTARVVSVAFSPDGKTLASGSYDNTIILWNVITHQPIGQSLAGHTDWVNSVAFSPDGKTLASGSLDRTIILWDVSTRQIISQPLTGHTNSVYSVAFSPDGKTLASGSSGTIILWDLATRLPVGQPLTGHTTSWVYSMAFSPDGKTLASGSLDRNITLWDVSTRQIIGQPLTGHASKVSSVAFSPDGKTLVSGSDDKTIILWNVEIMLNISITIRQSIGQPLIGNAFFISRFSPDGKTLASGSSNNTIVLWDVATRQPIGQPLTGHTDSVNSVAFSPNGKTLASGSSDQTIILWDVATHQPIGQPLMGHTDSVNSVAFSPNDKTLASGSSDQTIILWDVATRQPIGQPLTGHTSVVSSIVFSPDGKTLASGSWDQTIILWEVATHQPIGQPLTGHTHWVNSVAFSPDGKTLASGSLDSTIILWNVATHQPIGQPLTGHTSYVYSVTFSPDSKTLASSSTETILWDLNPQSWIEKSCQRVGRNFTRAEWEQYGFTEPYRKTCEQYPLEAEITPTPSPTSTP